MKYEVERFNTMDEMISFLNEFNILKENIISIQRMHRQAGSGLINGVRGYWDEARWWNVVLYNPNKEDKK